MKGKHFPYPSESETKKGVNIRGRKTPIIVMPTIYSTLYCSLRVLHILSLHYHPRTRCYVRRGSKGPEQLNNLPKAKQLVCDGARIQMQAVKLQRTQTPAMLSPPRRRGSRKPGHLWSARHPLQVKCSFLRAETSFQVLLVSAHPPGHSSPSLRGDGGCHLPS